MTTLVAALFAHIVNPSLNTAQFFFLCAAIVGVICVVFGFAPFGRPYPWAWPPSSWWSWSFSLSACCSRARWEHDHQ